MNLRTFTVGPVLTNCYVAWCCESREAIIVDPGFDRRVEAEEILSFLKKNVLKVKSIVDTHGHPDHTCGNGTVKEATDAPILIHKLDAKMLGGTEKRLRRDVGGFGAGLSVANSFLENGEFVRFGKVDLRVIHTPGHSPGSVSLVGENCVFTGDTLFAGSVGRVDLPGGSNEELMHSLREKLAVLPDRFVVYPGHGPKSTIENEKRFNPFLQRNFDFSLMS